jgi:enediyne polyketide synthase
MVTTARTQGGMASVEAAPALLAELLADTGSDKHLTIACFNAPNRHVVSGPTADVDRFTTRARERGVHVTPLDVTGAFHSPLMTDAAAAFGETLQRAQFSGPPRHPVISTVTGSWLPPDADLRAHLREQILAPVRFAEAARAAAEQADLLIEAGPGAALAGLMAENGDTPVVSLRAGERSPRRLLDVAAATWACGFTPTRELQAFAQRCTDVQASAR